MNIRYQTKPVPQPRHQVGSRGVYIKDTHPIHAFKEGLRLLARAQHSEPIDGPIKATVIFRFEKPKSSKRKIPSVRPDIDNLLKAVFDALNKIAYRDDAQICEVITRKEYGSPCVEITLEGIK